MRRRRFLAAAGLLVAAAALARPARAERAPLRMLRPLDLAALPLIVMEREHLIERTADAMGLGEVAVQWSDPGTADPFAALAAGQADLALAELVRFLAAADASGGPAAIRGVGAVTQRPYVLVARNPAIRTIRDFGKADRIAVPDAKLCGPLVQLEMAAAQEWGPQQYGRLDALVIALPDRAAAEALLAGKGGIDAHFSQSPYVDDELGDPAIHRVMDSFDIAGPHTMFVLAATAQFGAADREIAKAVLSALQAAGDLIRKNPGAAAESFAAVSRDDTPIEELSDLIGDPDLAYNAAPAGVLRIAAFLHRTGRLKRRPERWQDFFLPQSRDLAGS